jgi:hypothetical protein
LTLALGKTAPVGSVIVPVNAPVAAVCAEADAPGERSVSRKMTATNSALCLRFVVSIKQFMIVPPPFWI